MAVPAVPMRVDSPTTPARPAPRVKLPDVRRPSTPAPNTWADSQELEKITARTSNDLQPTNRDRYENKPLPEPSSQNVNLQERRHIQPAIPLVNTSSFPKHRAVTDPIQHRALLSTKKPSVTQLKKRGKIFEFSSLSKVDLSAESNLQNSNVPPKALQLLGVRQQDASGQQTSNTRIQNPSDVYGLHEESPIESPISVQPPPILTPPIVTQADLPDAFAGESMSERIALQKPPLLDLPVSDVGRAYPVPQETNANNLQPPVIVAFGSDGKQNGVVRQQILHPSKSFQAIIETASPASTEDRSASRLGQHQTPTKRLQHEFSGEVLRPTVYSPDSANGVWESDPAVGHTLPPFSPMPRMGHPDHQHVPERLAAAPNGVFQDVYRERFPRNPSAMHGDQYQYPPSGHARTLSHAISEGQSSGSWHPDHFQSSTDPMKKDMQPQLNRAMSSRQASREHDVERGPQHSIEHGQHGLQKAILDSRSHSVFHPQITPSNNSWATSSPAPPPQWPVLQFNNPVPSPPISQHDYPRPDRLTSHLAHLDSGLHYHIDTVFNALYGQIVKTHDSILDRVLTRIDNLEEKLSKENKGIKSEMNSIKKDLDKIRSSTNQKPQNYETVIDALQNFDGKLNALEGHIDQIKCKGHIQFADPSPTDSSGQHRRHLPYHHPAKNGHGSIDGSLSSNDRQYRVQHRNGPGSVAPSRSPSKSRHSGNSNGSELRHNRSRAASVSGWHGDEAIMEIGRPLGREKVRGPELKDHPAYKQQKEGGQASKQPLVGQDWYEQAYGP